MEKEMYKQLLKDGVKMSIIDAFTQHVKGINDIETLHKIKKELEGGKD